MSAADEPNVNKAGDERPLRSSFFFQIQAQSYEDKRCKCICPSIKTVDNTTLEGTDRMLIIDNVPPNKCNCDGVILPRIAGKIKEGKGQEICPRCDCKYENRNTTIIKVRFAADAPRQPGRRVVLISDAVLPFKRSLFRRW